jgi:hemerythrin
MLELTDDLRIGHPVIDADHQRLIEIINEFLEHSKTVDNAKVLHETLKSLMAYGKDHFAREERIQQECLYPLQSGHVHEHANLLDQVRDIARTYFVAKTRPLTADSVIEVNELLKAWLIGHVKKFDTGMREWVAPPKDPPAFPERLAAHDLAALVIDADPQSRGRLVDLLNGLGIAKVMQAEDSAQGLRMVFGDPVPDVILCCLDMEPVDGAALAGAMRHSSKAYIRRIPLLLLAVSNDAEAAHAAMAAGATGVIPKAFDPRNFCRLLSHVTKG